MGVVDRADTFFEATADRDGNADASHRGGNPGFLPGAQRLVDFTVERVVAVAHASPLRWGEPELSRFNP